MEDHIHVLAAANFGGFPSASNRDINLAVIRRMFASSLRIRWHVAYEEPNLPVAFRWRYRIFLQGVCLCHLWGTTWNLDLQPVFQRFNTPKSVFCPCHCHRNFGICLRISCISGAGFRSLKHTQSRRSFNTIKSVIPLDTHNNKHPLRRNADGYGSNTH